MSNDMVKAAPLEAYPKQDREFFAFWYSHMQGDLMQPPLAGISHSTARYIWDSALAAPKPEPMPLPRLTVSDSHMASLIEAAIQGHASTRDAMRWLVRQLATKPEPMTRASTQDINASRAGVDNDPDELPEPWSYRMGWRDSETHHGITKGAA